MTFRERFEIFEIPVTELPAKKNGASKPTPTAAAATTAGLAVRTPGRIEKLVRTWAGVAAILVVIATAAAFGLFGWTQPPVKLVEGLGVFARMYIGAQAIERFIEPFTYLDKVNSELEDKAATDQAAKADLDTWKTQRMFLTWSAATTLGMIASGLLGIYFLAMVIDGSTLPRWMDMLVTGVVIGGGSKAVHDLIENIQAGGEKKVTA